MKESELTRRIREMQKEFPVTDEQFAFDLKWNQKHRITNLQNDLRKVQNWKDKWLDPLLTRIGKPSPAATDPQRESKTRV